MMRGVIDLYHIFPMWCNVVPVRIAFLFCFVGDLFFFFLVFNFCCVQIRVSLKRWWGNCLKDWPL